MTRAREKATYYFAKMAAVVLALYIAFWLIWIALVGRSLLFLSSLERYPTPFARRAYLALTERMNDGRAIDLDVERQGQLLSALAEIVPAAPKEISHVFDDTQPSGGRQ